MSVSYASQQPFVSSAPVPSIDLNLMASVLQQKQGLFDANYAKAQSQLSTISSLDMLREDDKVYRDSKLNELTTNINSLSGDYSDPNISSQIDNSISSVYSDSRILNAISSTKSVRALQAGYQKMQTDPKMMKYFSDANYDADMAEVERYVSSTDPADSYRGKSTPTLFSSYMPDLVKTAQNLKASGWQRLEDGSGGYFNIRTGKTLTSDKISQNIMGTLDSNQRAQLSRDANYMWGKKLNLQPQELIGKITNNLDNNIKNIEAGINVLNLSKKAATVDELKIIETRLAQYQGDLTNTKTRKLEVEKQYNNYLKNGGSLEGLRFMAYEDDISKTLGNLFSWSEEKIDSKPNQFKIEEYKSQLRQNEMAIANKYKKEQIAEMAKYKDGSTYTPETLPPPIPNSDKTELNTENQLKFNNQLAAQYKNELQLLTSQKPEISLYQKGLKSLAEGKPAIVPRDADDVAINADIYSFGMQRLITANNKENVEAVWKEQNSLPIIEGKVDKMSLQAVKQNILQANQTYKSIDNIRLTNVGISRQQYRKNKEGGLDEDNDFYVDIEVKQGNEYVKVGEHKISPEYAKILSGGILNPESRTQMIINRGVDETNHFSTVVQSKIDPKTAFKLTVAKVDGLYEAFVEYEGKAIPLSAISANLSKGNHAWTSLEVARTYLKNLPTKDALAAKVKNYVPSAKDNLPNISFSNNNLYSSTFDWSKINLAPGPGKLNVLNK